MDTHNLVIKKKDGGIKAQYLLRRTTPDWSYYEM